MKLIALLALLFILPAHAYSGKELRADCLAAEGNLAASPEPDQPSRGAETVGVKLNAFCLPKSRDLTSRLVRSVLAHLDRQPPNPEGSTATLVAAALSRTFPCTELLEPRK